jgi:hypothetical protein
LDIIAYNSSKMIGTNLANWVDPRPGGYVMRPIHKFLLPALIICLIFGTVPTAFADELVDISFIDENVAKAPLVECGDPIADGKLILPATLVDYN